MHRPREISLAKYSTGWYYQGPLPSIACISDPVCDNAMLDQIHIRLLKITIVKYLPSWQKLLPSSSHPPHLAVLKAHAITRFNLFGPAALQHCWPDLWALQAHESTAQRTFLQTMAKCQVHNETWHGVIFTGWSSAYKAPLPFYQLLHCNQWT